MARIKTVTTKNAVRIFLKLHDKHRTLVKSRGRSNDLGGKRNSFVLELDSLFDIGAPDAVDEIRSNRLLSREKREEDIRFYADQKTERIAHMSGHDKIFEKKATQQMVRRERFEERLLEGGKHLTYY